MLRIDGLTVRFGGVEALGDLALAIAPGETVGLIGPNGAGKTTLFDAVTGVVRPAGGRIRIAGRDANGLAPHAIAGLGVARTFQGIRLFRRLSALDNVRAGRRVDAEAWLERVGLKHRSNALPDELAPAEQRRLELARALAADPRLLLLDEPVGGLTPAETDDLERLLRTVALPGRATILIEHRVDLVAALCRRIVVLDFGRKIADGAPDEVLRDSQVRVSGVVKAVTTCHSNSLISLEPGSGGNGGTFTNDVEIGAKCRLYCRKRIRRPLGCVGLPQLPPFGRHRPEIQRSGPQGPKRCRLHAGI